MAVDLKKLDANQVIKTVYNEDSNALQVTNIGGVLVPEDFDEMDLTYVASGDGVGEIETVTYKKAGDTVAVLTMTYNTDNKLSNVTRS